MNANRTVVAVNGSPHAAGGNTAMMMDMLRESLEAEGIAVETIHLCDRKIEYCIRFSLPEVTCRAFRNRAAAHGKSHPPAKKR